MPKKSSVIHPQWATKFRTPGTELRLINGRYYLYSVSSKYDPTLKRAKKITGKMIGSISEVNGLKPSKSSALIDTANLAIREFGFVSFLNSFNKDIEAKLKQFFPGLYKEIIYMAYCRLVHNSPIRDMAFYLSKSMISVDDNTKYSDKHFSSALRSIGIMREAASDYMKSFFGEESYLLVDMTHIFSNSKELRLAKEGYNSNMVFDKQFNLMYLYSPSLSQPAYFRLFPGNVREVRGFLLTIKESGLNKAVIVADKGFYSKTNIEELESIGLNYIIPVKRDNLIVEYQRLKEEKISYFKYNGRYIWSTKYRVGSGILHLYFDEELKVIENRDYLDRIETLPESYTEEQFYQRSPRFGTIALLTNIEEISSEKLYITYKSRNEVEVMFDGMKNVIHADRTYMQNEEALQGWMFINHIALQWYYIIYTLLKNSGKIKQYSIRNFIIHLNEIKKVKINGEWTIEPVIRVTEKMLSNLNINIT